MKRDRFEFRLGDGDRDLSRELRRYSEAEGSASHLIKELLRAYFSGDLDAFNQPGEPVATEAIDERVSALERKMAGATFKQLEKG